MSPEYVCLYADATREETLERVERSKLPAESLSQIFGMDTHRRLRGTIALADLVRAPAGRAPREHSRRGAGGARRLRPRGGRAR